MLLLLAPVAHAHPSAVPHVHPADPAGAALLGAWIALAVAWVGWVRWQATARRV